MKTPRRAIKSEKLGAALERLAREYVNNWIESGAMLTGDMKDRADSLAQTFEALILRDVDLFARTGKYPEYAQEEELVRDAQARLAANTLNVASTR